MQVREIYEKSVIGVESDESLQSAASRMQSHAVGSLAVYRNRKIVGIITERDLLRAASERADFASTSVDDCMTEGPVTVTPEYDVADAAALMVRVGTRHLPVVDESGQMLGMLSARDLLSVLGEVVREHGKS